MIKRIIYVVTPSDIVLIIFSILINAIGNGITVSLNLGSAFWTTSTVNLSHLIHVDLKLLLMIFGIFIIFFNCVLLKKIDLHRIFNNLLFMIPFSYFVGVSANYFNTLHLSNLPLLIRIIIDLVGIILIGIAVSIYQRIGLLLHPNDDFMQIIRYKFAHGNAAIAMWLSYIPPCTVLVISIVLSHKLYALNIGTIFSLLFQGTIVGIADRIIFPSLKHKNH